MPPIAYISRIENFSAAHRLHSPLLTLNQNKEIYGKCNSENGHGHNYKVEVTIRGQIDPQTGMIINMMDLKEFMKLSIMEVLDHKNLDLDVPYFQKRPSTTENLAIFIWLNLRRFLPQEKAKLYQVKLHETENNFVVFRGEGLDSGGIFDDVDNVYQLNESISVVDILDNANYLSSQHFKDCRSRPLNRTDFLKSKNTSS
ncbi:hypothetical protein G9A89_022506 [Geosiphon pyriformis]|nr:hypothetical protein G9A89_022506 [Geosiphon pyriformis]